MTFRLPRSQSTAQCERRRSLVWTLGTAAVVASTVTLVACQSKTKPEAKGLGGVPTPVNPSVPAIELKAPPSASGDTSPLLARPLTSAGDNEDARFSADGTRIVFVSRNRSAHKHAQIYEYSLTNRTERRLTFHDGEDASPIWRADGRTIVYVSTTDEIKEEPNAVGRLMRSYYPDGIKRLSRPPSNSPWPTSELYELTLGGEVERLTHSPGFDGDLEVDLKTDRLAFSSARSGPPQIYLLDRRGALSRLTDGKWANRWPNFSPDGKWFAWSRQELDRPVSAIVVSEVNSTRTRLAKPLAGAAWQDLHPAWHPLGEDIVFSSNRGGKAFNLYTVDRSGACVKRLTSVESDQLQPSFSPDGKSILFTWLRGNQTQIYAMDYRPPKDCWGQPSPSNATPNPAPEAAVQPNTENSGAAPPPPAGTPPGATGTP